MMKRREFISLLGGSTAAAWPLSARAQQSAMPVIGFVRDGSADANARYMAAFRKGLNETGTVEGQNATLEYHWLEGQHDRLPALMADLVRRQVAVIATAGNVPTLAAKAATTTIPIVFGVGDDPVRLGLVSSLARPGGNLTGINWLAVELAAKRLRLLHDLVPKAVRVAVLLNPANASSTESQLRTVQEAAPAIGLQIQILNATTIGEIDAAFATLERERPAFLMSDCEIPNCRAMALGLTPALKAARTAFSLPVVNKPVTSLATASARGRGFARAVGFSFVGLDGSRPRRSASAVTAASKASISALSNRFRAPTRSLGKKWRDCEAALSASPLRCGMADCSGSGAVGEAENRSGVKICRPPG